MQMPEERTVNKVFRNIPDGRRAVGKPKRGGWTMLNDLKKMVLEVGGGGGGGEGGKMGAFFFASVGRVVGAGWGGGGGGGG